MEDLPKVVVASIGCQRWHVLKIVRALLNGLRRHTKDHHLKTEVLCPKWVEQSSLMIVFVQCKDAQ